MSRILAVALIFSAVLAGCEGVPVQNPEFTVFDPKDQRVRDQHGTFTGTDGITIFSTARPRPEAETGGGGGGIGVNAYLWRGTLETIDFMPLASADPFGGLIITDWYQPPESPNERLKLQVLIRDRTLRADGLRVSVFRQTRDGEGGWADAPVDPRTALELEDKILTRARELRVAAVATAS
ncbi:MAG TPA: DUF3576 domain-containing protein [Geminicoccaceae bacterium]|nr:DUF3576 domain-containing protein [Geminicoccaceae bacterium]